MPCPPLVPISVIPPVSEGVAPILWRNGNQITRLNIPLNPSFLIYDGTKTRWGDGSAQAPVYLPNIQEVNSPTVTYVAGITSTGQLVKTLGASGTALVGGSAGSVVYQTAPSATGFTAVGTTGQLLSSNGVSAPTWLNQSAIAAGSLATARTISLSGDVTGTATSFNGSANITIPVTINAESVTPAKLSTGGPNWDTSGNLTATSFVGNVTGNVTGAGDSTFAGNVGIGTSSPIRKLHLANPSSVEQIWEQTDALADYRKYNAVVQSGSVSVGATYLFRILNDAGNASTRNIYAITPDGKIDTQGNPITNCPTTAKAWGGATSAGVIEPTTFGVSTITRSALGNYLVTMSTAVNGYSIVATPNTASGNQSTAQVVSTTQFRVYTFGGAGAAADAAFKFAVFGV